MQAKITQTTATHKCGCTKVLSTKNQKEASQLRRWLATTNCEVHQGK